MRNLELATQNRVAASWSAKGLVSGRHGTPLKLALKDRVSDKPFYPLIPLITCLPMFWMKA